MGGTPCGLLSGALIQMDCTMNCGRISLMMGYGNRSESHFTLLAIFAMKIA